MSESKPKAGGSASQSPAKATSDSPSSSKQSLSMHENVPVWYDCCSCEAEPYWLEQFGESADAEPQK